MCLAFANLMAFCSLAPIQKTYHLLQLNATKLNGIIILNQEVQVYLRGYAKLERTTR